MTYLVLGLGNPGEKYEQTRHNAGRIMAQEIARRLAGNKNVKFIIPDPKIMMNTSGRALTGLIKTRKDASKLIVIHDDLDLPIGKLKISWNRGTGGHRGLESILKQVKTTEFIRLRLGIAPVTPGGKIKKPNGEEKVLKHILGQFRDSELKVLKNLSKKASAAVEIIATQGRDRAMNLYN